MTLKKDVLLEEYDNYLDSDEQLSDFIRMNAEWNEESFLLLKSLVSKILGYCDILEDVPKIITFLFSFEIDWIINTISNPLFTKVPPENFTQEEYKDFINNRIQYLEQMKNDFYEKYY